MCSLISVLVILFFYKIYPEHSFLPQTFQLMFPSLAAVRADRMRGGRNKFGPMYKRDRALKQQKKALIRSNGFKLESAPPAASPIQTNYGFTRTLHGLSTISKGLLSSPPTSIIPTDYETNLYIPPSLGVAMQTHGPLPNQYQYPAYPSRPIKSECTDHYTSSPESLIGYPFQDVYPSGPPPSVPPLVMELLRCDPDELAVQSKIVAHLQQEQSGRGRQEKPSTFSLMCRMADQTLFSIVEWARSCIFLKELKVRFQKDNTSTVLSTYYRMTIITVSLELMI